MSFRDRLLERAARQRVRVVLCEGEDERVRLAVEQLRSRKVVDPIVLGGDGLDPAKDPRLPRIANFLRERRPDRIRDGVHALDVASEPVIFGAALVALGEAEAPAHQILVASGRGVERSGVHRNPGHGAWQKVMDVSP